MPNFLRVLNLANNQISKIEGLENCPNISELNIKLNRVLKLLILIFIHITLDRFNRRYFSFKETTKTIPCKQ
jgi:Leucine-rich repeat (LRR) protein